MRYLPFRAQEITPDNWLKELLDSETDVISKDYRNKWIRKMKSLVNVSDEEEEAQLLDEYLNGLENADLEDIVYDYEALYMLTGKKEWIERLEQMVAEGTQDWSKLVMHTFLRSQEGILVTMFLPCTLAASVCGTNIKVQSVPEHPFKSECRFIVETERPVEFQFKIRIPFWADEVKINGESIPKRPYVAIEKEFNGKEIIEVEICKK